MSPFAGAPFRAVIFDCDGVLADSEALGLEESAAYLRSHNLNWTSEELVRRFTGLRDDLFRARLIDEFRMANQFPPPPDFFDGLVAMRRNRRHELQEVDGASDFLSALPLPRAVASSSRAEVLNDKLARLGLLPHLLPHVYSGDAVACGKPAPDLFLHAADRLGTPPAECLVVEDSVNGVLAGVAAGMTVCAFVGGRHCFEGHDARLMAAGARHSAASFDQLRRLIGF
jgi:HAD superfamily hydrolase (TIGR01509 family)